MFQRFVSMVASGAPPPPVSAGDRRPAKERGVLSPAVAVGSESLHVFRRHGAVERVMAHVSGVRHFEATWYTSADTEALAAITAVDEVRKGRRECPRSSASASRRQARSAGQGRHHLRLCLQDGISQGAGGCARSSPRPAARHPRPFGRCSFACTRPSGTARTAGRYPQAQQVR